MIPVTPAAPEVDERGVTFRLPRLEPAVAAVRLVQDIGLPEDRLAFARTPAGGWVLRLDLPLVRRLEYLLELRYAAGRTERCCDPGNPRRAPGAFGEQSVVELPAYRRPGWLAQVPAVPAGPTAWCQLPSRGLSVPVRALLWSSAGSAAGVPLPLLVVHDGPEYAALAGLLGFLDVMVAAGRLPAMRAALLAPVERSEHYSASPGYAGALALGLLPALEKMAPTPGGRRGRIGMGASMGALGMLYAQRRYPDALAGLFLQSGSFFQPRLDAMESGFARFSRVTGFVRGVLRAGPDWPHAVPALLTCGSVEENLPNNRQMARALAAQGYGAALHVHPDAHNWVSWRDTWDPCLPQLVAQVWG